MLYRCQTSAWAFNKLCPTMYGARPGLKEIPEETVIAEVDQTAASTAQPVFQECDKQSKQELPANKCCCLWHPKG